MLKIHIWNHHAHLLPDTPQTKNQLNSCMSTYIHVQKSPTCPELPHSAKDLQTRFSCKRTSAIERKPWFVTRKPASMGDDPRFIAAKPVVIFNDSNFSVFLHYNL